MTTYYRVSDGALRDLSPEQFAALAPSKLADLRLYVVDTQPVPSATQVVVNAGVVVGPVEAHLTYSLRSKTAEELAAEAAAVERTTDVEQIRLVILALKNGTGTTADRLTRLEKVVLRLAKDALS